MRTPPRILVVDDNPLNVDILKSRLTAHGYDIVTAADGEAALAAVHAAEPDLILLDVMMPKLDGIEVCRRLRADAAAPFVPIILVTAKTDSKDVVSGLEAGADEYLTKPVDQAALVARVKSMLRIKSLHDTVQAQTGQLAEWNRTLERRVVDQVAQLDRLARLRRFLPPQIAEMVVSSGESTLLESHRRQITVLVCDLDGFSAFAETTDPEDVMTLLREYHAGIGRVIADHGGMLQHFLGDGVMVVFGAPVACDDPTARAVRLAVTMREAVDDLQAGWRKRGHDLGFSVGVDHGYATIGIVGVEPRMDYTAVGRVPNLAVRLCGEAGDREILVSQRAFTTVEPLVEADEPREYSARGKRPVIARNVRALVR